MEYCYVVPAGDELYHYGVKGMHWGIRRYQPYKTVPRKSGKGGVYKPTTKSGKAKLWKTRETERQAGRYDRKSEVIDKYISKKQEKLKEARKEGASERKIAKLEKKIDYGKTEKRINEKLKNAELKKIKNMSIDDVSSARLRKGAHYTAQVLKSTAVKALTVGVIGQSIGAFSASKKATASSAQAVVNAREFQSNADKFGRTAADAYASWATANTKPGASKAWNIMKSASHNAAVEQGWADRAWKAASYYKHASQFLTGIGFAAAATAPGAAALNLTRLGRVNEYSNLKGYERKSIVKKEKEAYKKRWK